MSHTRTPTQRISGRLSFRPTRSLAAWLMALVTAAAVAMAPVGTAGATARATSCKPPKYPGDGYFTGLSVTGTSCSQGNKLIVAFYKCRTKKSKSGRCTTKVLGYACTEKRTSIPTEIDARVTCKKSKATIVHTYQQNL